jgi:hypothetical protein
MSKYFITAKDVQETLCVGRCKAYSILQTIKNEYRSLPIAGKVRRSEFESWLNNVFANEQKRELNP